MSLDIFNKKKKKTVKSVPPLFPTVSYLLPVRKEAYQYRYVPHLA